MSRGNTSGDSQGELAELSGRDLETIIEAMSAVSGLNDSSVIANRAARVIQQVAGVDLVGVAVVEGDRSIVMIGSSGVESEWYSRLTLDVDIGKGFAGTILERRLPLFIDMMNTEGGVSSYDAADGATLETLLDPAYASHLRERMRPEKLKEYIGAPIEMNGELLGLLYAGNRERKANLPRIRAIMARFASMLAAPLGAARNSRDQAIRQIAAERETIAATFHDTIGQILFGIGVSARRALLLPAGSEDATRAALEFVEKETARASANLRGLLRTLEDRPAEGALMAEIQILVNMFTARSGVAVDTVMSGVQRPLQPDVRATLVQAVREGLHNIEKHADARTVVITLHGEPRRTALVIQDDGRGPGSGTSEGHYGLAMLRRRVERVGGELSFAAGDDGGATLRVVV